MQFLFRFKTHLPAARCANLGLSSNFQAEVDGEFQLRSCQIIGPPLFHSNSANDIFPSDTWSVDVALPIKPTIPEDPLRAP